MNPEERDRLVRLEAHYEQLVSAMSKMAEDVAEIKKFAYMGKGAWSLIIRVGAFVTIVGYAVSWMWEQVDKIVKH